MNAERKPIDMGKVEIDREDAFMRLEKEYLLTCAELNRIERQYKELLAQKGRS